METNHLKIKPPDALDLAIVAAIEEHPGSSIPEIADQFLAYAAGGTIRQRLKRLEKLGMIRSDKIVNRFILWPKKQEAQT